MNKRLDFSRCFRCEGRNTAEVGTTVEMFKIVYLGHCHDCCREYAYSETFDNVHDKEKRI